MRAISRWTLIVFGCVTSLAAALGGQGSSPGADVLDQLHFRSIGPAVMSGRVTDFAVDEGQPSIFYVGTAHSGVWKTVNGGTTFTAEFQDQGLMSIGAIAVSPANPDVVWIGTGEGNNRQSTSWGDGVWKSADGGRTWTHCGLETSYHINRIALDPVDPNVVFVAAQGSLFGSGGARGVYRTTDGGTTWKAVLAVDDNTGANEVLFDPTNRQILYASTYERQRSPCCFDGGGPGSGIWKSVDGGDHWTRITAGLPQGDLGRIGLAVYRRSPNILYALIEAEGGGRGGGRGGAPGAATAGDAGSGLFRSDDAGASWRRISAQDPRPMYFSQIRIDPNNPDRVITAGVQIFLSIDGGKTFAQADATIHDDIHAIWWDPANSNHVMIGSDGGVGVSYDLTKRWTFLWNLPIGLFYHVGFDYDVPYNVCGGMQDNDAWCGPSVVRNQRGITPEKWTRTQIGDGMETIADALDSRITYGDTQDGSMQRKNKITGESKTIRPGPQNVVNLPPTAPGAEATAPAFRFNWNAPMTFSPNDPHVLLVAGNRLFRSTDRGDTWTVISPDLTTNANRDDLTIMGVKDSDVRFSRNDGITAWPTIVSFAESGRQPGLYYTGTDDGVVSVSKDGGRTWQNVTDKLPGFPKGGWVSAVVPSRFEAGRVYVTVDAHRLNDYGGYVWASEDFGASFHPVTAGLEKEAVKTLTEDLHNPDVLYVGGETGLFVSIDRGRTWRRLKANLPTVRVDEITLHPRDNAMILATHGRAIWILDHLEPIQELATASAKPAALFSVPTALEWKSTNELNMEFWGDNFFLGENPPIDAEIPFLLQRPSTDVHLKIADATGHGVRDLTVPVRSQSGLQLGCWDLRVDPIPAAGAPAGRGRGGAGAAGAPAGPGRGRGGPAVEGPDAGFENPCGAGRGGGGGGGNNAGPYVLPGNYTVTLVVDGATVETKPMKVVMDPEVRLTDAQRRAYFDLVIGLHDLQRRGEEAARALTTLSSQVADATAHAKDAPTVSATTRASLDEVAKALDAVRVKFGVGVAAVAGGRGAGRGGGAIDPRDVLARAGALKTQIMAFWETPSDALAKQAVEIREALPKAIAEANACLLKAMTVSQALAKANITLTVPAPVR